MIGTRLVRMNSTRERRIGTGAALFVMLAITASGIAAPLSGQDRRGLEVTVKNLSGEHAAVGRQIAVLIAVDKYREWQPLKNPVKDAREIRAILEKRYWIDEFEELYDEDATKAGLLRLFDRLVSMTKPEDSVFIYYVGHGQMDTISDTGFWIPVDAGTYKYEQKN